MPNKNYRRGYNFERKVRQYLDTLGYFTIRSSGSHTPVDVVAFPKNNILPDRFEGFPLLIQCKTDGSLSKKESLDMHMLALDIRGVPIMASKNARGHMIFSIINYDGKKSEVEI